MRRRANQASLREIRAVIRQIKADRVKKQAKLKPLIFVEETYDFKVHILAPCDMQQFAEYVLKTTELEYEDHDGVAVCFSTVDHVILGLKEWSGSVEDIATLSHELFHATSHALSLREMGLSEHTEEAYAYLNGSLMLRCLRLLNENH